MSRIYEDYAYSDAPRATCGWGLDTQWQHLSGDASVDTCIIGAGFTGLSAALTLAEAGENPMVLDAQTPGWGASGRNGGFCCLGGAKIGFDAMATRFGRSAASEFLHAEANAIDLVADLLARNQIDASTHSDGELQLAHRPRHARDFADEARLWNDHGIETRILEHEALAAEGMIATGLTAGLHVRKGFGLDPGAYVVGLARAAQHAGADIRARSPVTKITKENGTYRLTTPTGTVTARRILLATNGYSSDDLPPWLRARYLPVQSNVLLTRPLTKDERDRQGWFSDLMAYDTRILLHYFRLLPDGRFLFGMRGGIRSTPRAEAKTRARLIAHFHAMFPAWQQVEITAQWSGLANLSRALVPFIGPIDDDPNALVAMAYHGNGVAFGTFAGRASANLWLGNDTRPTITKITPPRFPLSHIRRNLLRVTYPAATLADSF